MYDFSEFPVLHTARLTLRQITMDDANDALHIWGDPDVRRFISDVDDSTSTLAGILPILEWTQQVYAQKHGIRWGITLNGDNKLIGTAGFHALDRENHHAEIGYDLAKVYWRQGIMTEALREIIRFCFLELDLHRIEADVTAGNDASAATLRKLGFSQEGTWRERVFMNGRYDDLWQFGLLRHEYE